MKPETARTCRSGDCSAAVATATIMVGISNMPICGTAAAVASIRLQALSICSVVNHAPPIRRWSPRRTTATNSPVKPQPAAP